MKDNSKIKILTGILLTSIAFALFVDAIWLGVKLYWLDNWGLETGFLYQTIYVVVWSVFIIPATSIFKEASRKRNALDGAIRDKDKKRFMRYVDLQISWITDVLFMVCSAVILTMTFLFKSDVVEGLIVVSIISWGMMGVRLTSLVIDNPLEGAWVFSPLWKFFRIGIWEIPGLPEKWKHEALTREPLE